LGTKGQHATSRPLKPLFSHLQMVGKSRGKQRHCRLRRCFNDIKIDHRGNYREIVKWKHLSVVAVRVCWCLLNRALVGWRIVRLLS
jgi:hypothetical protein